MAEDVQREVIADMLRDAGYEFQSLDELRALDALQELMAGGSFALKYFDGYPVVSKPTGSGVRVVYHKG